MTPLSWALATFAAVLVPLFAIRVMLTRANPRFALAHGLLGVGCLVTILPQQVHPDFMPPIVAGGGALLLISGAALLMKITTGGYLAALLDSLILASSSTLLVTSCTAISTGQNTNPTVEYQILITWLVCTACILLARFALAPHGMVRHERILLCAAAALACSSQVAFNAALWLHITNLREIAQIILTIGITTLSAYLISRARTSHANTPYTAPLAYPTMWWYSVGVLAAVVTSYGYHAELLSRSLATVTMTYGFILGIILRVAVAMKEIRALESKAQHDAAYYHSLVSHSSDVTLVCHLDGTVKYASDGTAHMLGGNQQGFLNQPLASIIGADPNNVADALTAANANHADSQLTRTRLESTRNTTDLETVLSVFEGQVIASIRDVTERNSLRATLRTMAYIDAVTELPNRHSGMAALENALAHDRTQCSAVLADIDRFKQVNDSGGHALGDQMLQKIGQRLRTAVGPDVTLARLGGDEFLAVVDHRAHSPSDVAAQLAEAMTQPLVAGERTFQLGASVGVAHADTACDAEELLRRADIAMFAAKRNKRPVMTYHDGLSREATSNVERDAEIAAAIRERRFELHLQPVVDMTTGELHGAEALVRWVNTAGTVHAPAHLLDFARRTGQLRPITDWVVEQSVTMLAALPSLPRISINIPPGDLLDPTLASRLLTVLDTHQVAADRLCIEITEDELLSASDRTKANMVAIQDAGLKILIDDFGTGYSSLGNISELPISGFKLDRSFVRGIHNNPRAKAVVRALSTVAEESGFSLIVEGVESAADHRTLRDLGCQQAQGFFYAKPELIRPQPAALSLSAWGERTADSLATVREEFAPKLTSRQH